MSSTQFVQMYHPLIAESIAHPVLVALQSADDHAARGWLLVDPDVDMPEPSTPYYTREALLSQIQGGAAPIGTALREASIAALEDAADVAPTGAWDFTDADVTGIGSTVLAVAATVTSNGALVVGKHNPVDATGGARTMTLPTGSPGGTFLSVEKADATSNLVTVTGSLRGAAAQTLNLPWSREAVLLVADATGSWWPVAGHKTKTSLDRAYATVSTTDALGTNLVKVANVLSISAGSWDNNVVEGPVVGWDPQVGKWAMTYVGYNNTGGVLKAKTGLAYSDDLVTWTKFGTTPILEGTGVPGDPDQSGTSGPVWLYENGTYHLFYIGLTADGYEAGTKRICHATAPSLTGPWTRQGAVITPNVAAGWRSTAVWHPNFVKRGSTWYCFFNANGSSPEQIGYATATSLDGPWTVDDVNSPLVTVGGAGTWEATLIGDPCVRRVGDLWVMDYYGYNTTTDVSQDGVATTTDALFPLGWTKYAGNPILKPTPGSYDGKSAGKPWTMVVGGQVLHYYTAIPASGPRSIALAATSIGTGGSSTPVRVTAPASQNNPAAWFTGTVTTAQGSTLIVGPNDLGIGSAAGRARLQVGNSAGSSDLYVGQGQSNNVFLAWTYNATAANAVAELATWNGTNRLNIQNNAGAGGVMLGGTGGKVAFLGTAPITKRATTADASDLPTVIALANALKADLVAYGLKA